MKSVDFIRTIIHCAKDNYIFAARAAKFLLEHPARREAWLEYGDKVEMYAKRNNSSITIKQVKP